MWKDYLEFAEVKPGMRLINAEDIGYSMDFCYMFITEVSEKSIKYDSISIGHSFISIRKAEEFRNQWMDKALRDERLAKARWDEKSQIEQSYDVQKFKAKELDDHYMHLAFHHMFNPDKKYKVGDQDL